MDEDKKEAMETTECMLLAAAQAGDSAAMMQLVEQYEPLLRRAAAQVVSAGVAEDVPPGLGLGHVPCAPPHDDDKLRLIVVGLSPLRQLHRRAARHKRVCKF